MEKIRIYDAIISLKEIALRKVSILLWCQPDILASLSLYDVDSEIQKNIEKLELPEELLQPLKHLVKPIGSRIRDWKIFHEDYLDIGNINIFYILKHLCWTRLGIIDYKKTAETVLHLEMLDIVKRYRLACLYCLDEYIPVLWNQLSEERKAYFIKDKEFTEPQLEFCWPYLLTGEVFFLDFEPEEYPFGDTPYFDLVAFQISAYKGNKAAADYFFHQIPNNERYDPLFNMAQEVAAHRCRQTDYQIGSDIDDFSEESLSDVFCYLLSLMDPGQQNDIFKDQPSQALVCLLDWPYQEHFLEVTKRFWDFLEADDYVFVINAIVGKIKLGFSHLTELFHNFFWLGSSDFIKEFVKVETRNGFVLRAFIRIQDSKTIQVIFRKLDFDDRKMIVFSKEIFKLFYKSMSRGQRHLVELCLKEAALSKAEKKELKGTYFKFLSDMNESEIELKQRENNWKEFLHFFDH